MRSRIAVRGGIAQVAVFPITNPHLWKTATTVNLYLSSIGYAHRLQLCPNPQDRMRKVRVLIQWALRRDGPRARKLVLAFEVLLVTRRPISAKDAIGDIACCVIAIGRRFTIGRSVYLRVGSQGGRKGAFRHSIRMCGVGPLFRGGGAIAWGGYAGAVSLHLDGGENGLAKPRNGAYAWMGRCEHP